MLLHQVITDYSRDVPPTAMSLDGPGARRCESNTVPLIVPRGLPSHRFVRYVRPPASSPGRESVPLYPLQPATRQIRVLVDTGRSSPVRWCARSSRDSSSSGYAVNAGVTSSVGSVTV